MASQMRERRASCAPTELKLVKTQKREDDREEAETQPLSPGGRMFHLPNFNCYIIAIMGSAKKIDVELIKSGIESTLLKHPRFSSVQVLDDGREGRWVKTKVVVGDHIVVPNVDSDIPDPDKFVEDYMFGLTRTKLDLSKPLWDVHVLNIRTSDAEAVAAVRIHHSLGDGVSLISLLLACTRKSSDPSSPPTIPTVKTRTSGNHTGLFSRLFGWILALLMLIRNTVVDMVMFICTFLFLKDTQTPFKGFEGVESRPRRYVRRTLSLDDFRLIKNTMNGTMNDVMLGVTSAGLSKYLAKTLAKERTSGQSLLRNIRVRAAMLVNIRPAPGIHALAEMMEKNNVKAQWGNWLGYILLPFTIAQLDDPLDYVRKAKQIVDRKKNSYEAFFTFSSGILILKTLGLEAAAAFSHRVLSNVSITFSNVMGPTEEISFMGHPLVYLAPSSYGHPHALMIHFQSYMNKVELVLAVDEASIPDPQQLCQDLVDALALIKAAVMH